MIRSQKIILGFLIVLLLCASVLASILVIVPPANQRVYELTQLQQLHLLGLTGEGITIGLIDTGVDYNHQEFSPSSFSGWNDVIHNQAQGYDDGDHGTHIAGLLVAQGTIEGSLSGIHLQGITPQAQLLVVKAVSQADQEFGTGNDSLIAEAITYCIEHDADIILLSLGNHPENILPVPAPQTQAACLTAIQNGICVIAPAGDDGDQDDEDVAFPASIPKVLSVGAVNTFEAIASFSSQGHQYPDSEDPHKKPELVAPGVRLCSTRGQGSYGQISGTSQAAAMVTGCVALLLEAYPQLQTMKNETRVEIMTTVLIQTAKSYLPSSNQNELTHDDHYGYGLIQAYDAYVALAQYIE